LAQGLAFPTTVQAMVFTGKTHRWIETKITGVGKIKNVPADDVSTDDPKSPSSSGSAMYKTEFQKISIDECIDAGAQSEVGAENAYCRLKPEEVISAKIEIAGQEYPLVHNGEVYVCTWEKPEELEFPAPVVVTVDYAAGDKTRKSLPFKMKLREGESKPQCCSLQ